MEYKNIQKAVFLSRPNRFIAHVEIDGNIEKCHVKNTGRLKELLLPNATVYVEPNDNPNRKTKFSLIAVESGGVVINIDSQCPNKLFHEASGDLFDYDFIKPEYTYKDSRFDFYMEKGDVKSYIEIKGVTLIENSVAMFPDAPSERAIKHIEHLIDAVENGHKGYIVFIVKTDTVTKFTPNPVHNDFVNALIKAKAKGVNILAYSCEVKPEKIRIKDSINVLL